MKRFITSLLVLVLILGLSVVGTFAAEDITKFDNIDIRFFVGGSPGDVFASRVLKGAKAAEADFGVNVKYIFSGWNVEKMVSQFRDAIAANPDGIAMMGHPGNDALMPLAERADEKGITMMYQNVDVPKVREKFGGGYVGIIDLGKQGRLIGKKAIEMFGLEKGDRAVVFGAWGQPGRYLREEGTALAFEDIGMTVQRIVAPPEAATSPELLIPKVTSALSAHPDTEIIVFPGGQNLSSAPRYMQAAGVEPGEVKCIGFDLSKAVLRAFEDGYVQLTAVQQPFLQGYLPIQSIAFTEAYRFSPIIFDTGAGFVTKENYKDVLSLVEKGIR